MSRPAYYRADLALVHHRGFASHAETCAPGILELLRPVREQGGLVLELGCGSGLLTRHLADAGHRVLATDASPAMLELARRHAPGSVEVRRLVLPDDPLPEADAVVSVGHVVSYLDDEAALERALRSVAGALRPGGLFALDVCDREWGEHRRDAPPFGRVGDDWAIVSETSVPAPDRLIRRITTFLRNDDGTWRRDDERHENVLVDTVRLARRLCDGTLSVTVAPSFGDERLPRGLRVLLGRRAGVPPA